MVSEGSPRPIPTQPNPSETTMNPNRLTPIRVPLTLGGGAAWLETRTRARRRLAERMILVRSESRRARERGEDHTILAASLATALGRLSAAEIAESERIYPPATPWRGSRRVDPYAGH